MLTLLGPPTVAHADGRRTPWPTTRPGALLAYLACRPDWVARDELAFLMRPDAPDQDARRYLRQLLHRAASFPWVVGLEVVDDRVRWDVTSDLDHLRDAIARDDHVALLAAPPAPLLAGFAPPDMPAFSDWLELERAQVHGAWCDALLRHARACEVAGDDQAAIEAWQSVLSVAPLDETTLQALMHACLRRGAAERALHAFERFARGLERDVACEPLEATLALADAARQRLATLPARGAPVARRDALPRPATRFVGREAELARLEAWLGGDGRLVSVVGLGGCGKTRLVIEAARRSQERFERGVAFLRPTGAGGVDEVLAALASRFGVADPMVSAPGALGAQLAGHIGGASALVLLDEAEHLPAERLGAALLDVLEAAPNLRVLLTSRAPLGLHAEHVLHLDGLAVHQGDAVGTGERASASDAVALFDQCVARLGVEVPADDATREAVRALCRMVGGLPLALELAAVRTRTRSLPALLEELRDGVDGLRTDAADVPERHRSLGLLVRQAWDALAPSERDALTGLTVFGAAWTMRAAERVAAADLPTLTRLVERSLVRRVGVDRFEVHALIRSGAPAAPTDATRDAHAAFILGWLADLTPVLAGGSQQAAALDEVHAAFDDVRRAWHHALERAFGVVPDGARFRRDAARAALAASLTALDHALHARSLWQTAIPVYEATLMAAERDPGVATDRLRARVEVRLACVERQIGRSDVARRRLHAALERLGRAEPPSGDERRTVGERHGAGPSVADEWTRTRLDAQLELASLDERVGAYGAAEHGFRAVIAAADATRDLDLLVQAHSGLSNVSFAVAADLDEAMEHAEHAVRLGRRLGDRNLLSVALVNLGAAHHDVGRMAAARRAWGEAADLAADLGHGQREAVAAANLGAVAETLGDVAAARAAYERSLALRQRYGDRAGEARVLVHLGRLARSNGDLDSADAYLEAAVHGFEDVDDPADLALAEATRARIRVELGDLRSARRATERALRLGRLTGDRVAILTGLLADAAIAHAQGRTADAARTTLAVRDASEGREAGVHASACAFAQCLNGVADRAPSTVDVPIDTLVDEALTRGASR